MASFSDYFMRFSSPDDQELDCPHHDSPREGLCTALTQAGKACSRRAKAAEPGFAPLCYTHRFEKRLTGNCQAVEECGHVCNRLAPYEAPYHLCKKHQDGTDTLPCHLMRLPTEIRMMIFRYIFPKNIYYDDKHSVKVAILKVNRQIYEEASSVLYGESHFQAYVGAKHITLQGKSWYRKPFVNSTTNSYDVDKTLCQTGARLIRNLEVKVSLGMKSKCPKGINTRGITQEDQELYIIRDSVRKLVELFSSPASSRSQNALKRLTVKPEMRTDWAWQSDEAVVALFFTIEPFQGLRQIDHPFLEAPSFPFLPMGAAAFVASMLAKKLYIKLEEQWRDSIQASASAPHYTNIDAAVCMGYRKIEAFVQLIYAQDATTTRAWTTTIFHGIERPMHLARVAYENNDHDAIVEIHDVITVRWINAHRQQQGSLRAVADSINSMFENTDSEDDESTTPRKQHPDAFNFEDIAPIKQEVSHNYLWPELSTEDDAPKRGDPGVTVKERGLRRYIRKDDKEWVRLMTPAMVRMARVEKQLSSQV